MALIGEGALAPPLRLKKIFSTYVFIEKYIFFSIYNNKKKNEKIASPPVF